MITNLLFKRNRIVEGQNLTEMKVVEILIPELKPGEGWQLVSSADKISTVTLARTESTEEIEEREAIEKFRAEYRTNRAKKKIEAVLNPTDEVNIIKNKAEADAIIEKSMWSRYDKITEVPSNTPGTACLIRKGDSIRIAYRTGKKADISTPNKVCINDYDKQHFFNAVKRNHGGGNNTLWQLVPTDSEYEEWNSAMDTYYQEQRKNYLKYLSSKENK